MNNETIAHAMELQSEGITLKAIAKYLNVTRCALKCQLARARKFGMKQECYSKDRKTSRRNQKL